MGKIRIIKEKKTLEDVFPVTHERAVFDSYGVSLETKMLSKQNSSDRVTSIDESSTDAQYPSAKAVYTYVEGLEEIVGDISTVLDNIDNEGESE